MPTIQNIYYYDAFGSKIYSEFYLPELIKYVDKQTKTDIHIIKKDLQEEWSSKSNPHSHFVFSHDSVLFCAQGIAIFSIERGSNIYVCPLDNNKQDEIRLYLLGTCMGALLMQRNILPLHGSAIAINGKAYAIVGECGAGKSTLARAFIEKGYKLITDDIIPLVETTNKGSVVIPSYPYQKLWLESLNSFKMDADNYQAIAYREEKYSVPIQMQYENKALPLVGVIELKKERCSTIKYKEVLNLERLQTLYMHTFRNIFLQPLGLLPWHLSTTTRLLESIKIVQITRPDSYFTANELAEWILHTFIGDDYYE
ncbi:aldolase [Bacillus sp. B1-b2]|uniref:aldolase n=1 Tax=Bacillus sp. B1-b2 TaxID=2653201 RepID=UPI0012616A66|nr:aldolase [Bacillus sp. B1-b2]KAB7671710.1 aldolase [Bacillus sp. B1-b2]